MFRKRNLIITALLGVSMACVGCNSDKASNVSTKDTNAVEEINAKELVQKACKELSSADSYEANTTMAMSVKGEGETVDLNMDMDMKVVTKPSLTFQMDTKMGTNQNGQEQSIDMQQFIVEEESGYVLYSGVSGAWTKTPLTGMDQVNELMKNPIDGMEKCLNDIDDITISGDKTINGIDCREVKMNLTKEYFETAFSELGGMDGMGLNLDESLDALEGIDSLEVFYYISKEDDSLVGCNIDMGEFLKQMLEKTQNIKADSIDCTMEMIYDNINGVSEITVPEEAKSAM